MAKIDVKCPGCGETQVVLAMKFYIICKMVQKVEIYYKMIGYVELPEMSESEKESFMKSFGRTESDKIA